MFLSMIRYQVNSQELKNLIKQMGFVSLSEFAGKFGINRATLNHYFKGEGPLSESYYKLCESLQIDPISILSPVSSNLPSGFYDIMPVVKKLCEHDKSLAVGLLGSRAKGTNKKYSDWDIGVTRGQDSIGGREFLNFKQIVDDASDDLQYNIDVINLAAAPDWFLHDINYEPIFLAGNMNAWAFFMGVIHGAKKKEK